jgi:CRP/FNR family transcriptional regulator, cyclic AMP receptor protein
MPDIFELTDGLPDVHLAAGETLITEGGEPGGIWILMSGTMRVLKQGMEVNSVTHPGAIIGEMSLLLGRTYTATVEAVEPCVLRHAADGLALMASDAEVTRLIATGLAERLAFVTTYLADLKQQYGDAPGLAMVGDVLRRLEQRRVPRAVPGSAREPDPEY